MTKDHIIRIRVKDDDTILWRGMSDMPANVSDFQNYGDLVLEKRPLGDGDWQFICEFEGTHFQEGLDPSKSRIGTRTKELTIQSDAQPDVVTVNGVRYVRSNLSKPTWPDGLFPRWRWLARDKDGYVYVYTSRPTISYHMWVIDDDDHEEDVRQIDELLDFDHGTCDWKDSLIERPLSLENMEQW